MSAINTLEVTQRPVRELFVNKPPEEYDTPYYTSNWNSAHLPIIYKLSNDRFPANTLDMVDTFLSVSNNNGNAQINLQAGYVNYIAKNYVEITGSTNYNGIHRILSVSGGRVTIDVAFVDTDSGNLQTHYQNYFVGVRVYAGRPDYHPLNGGDPMTLITENPIRITPDADNIATVDLSGLIRNKISQDFDPDSVNLPNDTNAWTSFYIEFYESFGESEDGFSFDTVVTDTDTDEFSGCEGELDLIENGDFSSGLTDWDQEDFQGGTQAWVSGGGGAQISAVGFSDVVTRKLFQELSSPLEIGIPYIISFDVTNNNGTFIHLFAILKGSVTGTIFINPEPGAPPTDQSFSFQKQVILTEEVTEIGFVIFQAENADIDIVLDNVSITVNDCKPYIFAHNGIKQFQDQIGGNFGDYVANANLQLVSSKWLNGFTTPVLFDEYYFDLSTIIPESTWSNVQGRELFLRIKEYDNTGALLLQTDVLIDDVSDGTYRIRLDDFVRQSNTYTFNVRLIGFPANSFEDGIYGTFDFTVDGGDGTNDPSDWGITKFQYSGGSPDQIGASYSFQTSDAGFNPKSGAGFMNTNPSGGSLETGILTGFRFDTQIGVISNADYELKGYMGFTGGAPDWVARLAPILMPEGYSLAEMDVDTTPARDLVAGSGIWTEFKTVFNTGANTSLRFFLNFINDLDAAGSGGMTFVFDEFTLRGPIFNLTEEKTVKIYDQCIDPAYEPLYLRWMDGLGAWDGWLFTARKEHITDVDEKVNIRRSVLSNFPDNFINGETEDDFIRINAFRKLTVRSQYLTKDQIEGVKGILYAIRVQHVLKNGNKITVLVDRGSFTIREDRQKLYTIEFTITYTDPIRVQSQ